MDKILELLITFLYGDNEFSNEEQIICRYGLRVGIEMTICFVCCLLIALFLEMPKGFFIFFGIFFSVRSYVGGIHMDSYFKCLICSCIVFTGTLLSAKHILLKGYIAIFLIYFCSGIIYNIAEREKYTIEEKEYYNQKLKKVIITILIVSAVLLVLRDNKSLTLIAYTCFVILLSKTVAVVKEN